MDFKLQKLYRIPTFSLFGRTILMSSLTLGGILFCTVLVVVTLTEDFVGTASASKDNLPLLLPLVCSFLWACCTLGEQLLSLESLLVLDDFFCNAVGFSGGGSWFLSLRTCCKRWVSFLCSCFWRTRFESETDNFCADGGQRSCCPARLERGSLEEIKRDFFLNNLIFACVSCFQMFKK